MPWKSFPILFYYSRDPFCANHIIDENIPTRLPMYIFVEEVVCAHCAYGGTVITDIIVYLYFDVQILYTNYKYYK